MRGNVQGREDRAAGGAQGKGKENTRGKGVQRNSDRGGIMITEKNLINHELVGLKAEVAGKFAGEVVLETKNMLGIQAGNSVKKFPKLGTSFVFTLPNGKRVSVEGKRISSRPEDRIKSKVRKWQ